MIVQTQSYLKKEPVEGLNDETTKKSNLQTSELRNLKKSKIFYFFPTGLSDDHYTSAKRNADFN